MNPKVQEFIANRAEALNELYHAGLSYTDCLNNLVSILEEYVLDNQDEAFKQARLIWEAYEDYRRRHK